MRRPRLGLVMGGLLLFAPALSASPPPARTSTEGLISGIDAAQSDLRTLRAEFVQRNRVKLFKQELISRGRLRYQRGSPSMLRWEYLSPDPSTLVLIGNKVRLAMPGRAPQVFDTASDTTLRAIFEELELWLGSRSIRSAKKDYEIKSAEADGGPALVLYPREHAPLHKTFSRIEMRVDAGTMQLRSLLLVERSGDEKEIHFSRMERNVGLSRSEFMP